MTQGESRSDVWLVAAGFAALVLVCVAVRLLPHPPNATPLAAVGLLAGFATNKRIVALVVPLGAMLISDAVIGFYDPRLMAVVYASLGITVALSGLLRQRFSMPRLFGCSVAGSIVFFVTTNFAVWLWGGFYSPTWSGLARCYVAATPFFRFTLLGDLAWSCGLFAAYALATAPVRRKLLASGGMTVRLPQSLVAVRTESA